MTKRIDFDKLIWRNEYNIGNMKIDNEHQKLFSLARMVFKQKDTKDEDLKKVVLELFKYVKVHFAHEESFMKEIKYPSLKEHKQIHQDLLIKLKEVVTNFNDLEVIDIKQNLFDFLEKYFITHIIVEDKKLNLWQTDLNQLRKSFGWKDLYTVGNKIIDEEHKQLFDIAKEAFLEVEDKNRKDKIKTILTDLYDYMFTHFKHEEEYMKSIDYPLYEEHLSLHRDIISTLNDFVKKLPNFNTELFEKELARLIDIVLVQHIIQEDRKITNYQSKDK